MITFAHPLALLLALPVFVLAIMAWRHGYVNLSERRRRLALGVRLALLAAIILGLAGAGLRLSQGREAVVFVADLSASDAGKAPAMQNLIRSALAGRPASDVAGIVTVGREAQVELPVSPLGSFDGFQTAVDPNYTNLQSGVELAGAILPPGYRRRIVLISDGQQNVGDALGAARLLRSQGIRVDVAPVHMFAGPEVLVDGMDVPSALRTHERFSVAVRVSSTVDTTTRLDLYRDHALILARSEVVHRGVNEYVFSQPPLRSGFHSYQVVITPAQDTQAGTNTGAAFTAVQGPPRVLVIASAPREAVNVMASLRTTGVRADLMAPAQVVPTLGFLQQYASIVIVDTASDVLGPTLMAQLVPFVRDLGHGLVVIGGQEAYGMGSYGQTPLEQALPVKMDLPKRKNLPSAAVVLIIESLESNAPINISKQAGKGVVDLLGPQDQVAVNDAPYDGSAGWAVPLQHVRNKSRIDHQIEQMQPGDPMSYVQYLQSAYASLKHAHAGVKHIILLGDGDAEDQGYQTVLKAIRAGGVTVSTVATNGFGFADFQTMRDIARWGGGRYYQADNTNSIPKIFLREARTVARSGIVEGKFYPQEISANPMVADLHSVPPLSGYVATTPKPTAEMVLVSNKLDPVLAGWQFGLGRAVAWTSDASGQWTRDWLQAPGANRFWSNLVSWTLPATQSGRLFVALTSANGQGRIEVDTPGSLGADPSLTARIAAPDLQATTIQLEPSAPGRYDGTFLATERGTYVVTVEARGAGHAEAGQAGLAVSYPAEYRTTGTNTGFLKELASAGGGNVIARPADAWLNNLAAVYAETSLTGLLWLLAILLLPVDIAVRRLVIGRQDLAAIRAALPFGRHRPVVAEPVVEPLGALRRQRAYSRTRADGAQPASSVPPAEPLPATPRASASPVPTRRPKPAPQPESGTSSTAGALLAAKRRRR